MDIDVHITFDSKKIKSHKYYKYTHTHKDKDTMEDVMNRPKIGYTQFLAWFDCNRQYKSARELTYAEIPTKFIYDGKEKEWKKRSKKGTFALGRLQHVSLNLGEYFYLRCILNQNRGAMSYDDLKTVKGVVYDSFEDACYHLGLLDDDKEYIEGLKEAGFWAKAPYFRKLFAILLLSGSLAKPDLVWAQTWIILAEDILQKVGRDLKRPNIRLNEDQLRNYTLIEVEKLFRRNRGTLRKFDKMPKPEFNIGVSDQNQLLQDEQSYDQENQKKFHDENIPKLTDEQRCVYNEIIGAVFGKKGGVFFVYGFGGTEKTFLWKILATAIRSKGEIVLNVASSGIASLLLEGGRTAHSRFSIPINPHEFSTCNIEPGSHLAELVAKASLIIWDEAPMMSKHCFESLDRSLCDLMKDPDNRPFGGKVVVFGGDFRQVLPVIPKGSRADIVMASLNSSYLWNSCKVLQLTRNMRLLRETNASHAQEIADISKSILDIGDGKINEPNDGEALIEIPEDILLTECEDPIEAIVSEVYGKDIADPKEADFFQERAILCPTNDDVDKVNQHMLNRLADICFIKEYQLIFL